MRYDSDSEGTVCSDDALGWAASEPRQAAAGSARCAVLMGRGAKDRDVGGQRCMIDTPSVPSVSDIQERPHEHYMGWQTQLTLLPQRLTRRLGEPAPHEAISVSGLAVTCTSWAETITGSQAWLWSVVAACSLPVDVCSRLESWCSARQRPLRQGLQLWLCRAKLWGAPEAACCSPVSISESPHWGAAAACCTSWCPEAPQLAMGFGDSTLHFGALEPGEGRGLRGALPSKFRWDASVRSAHGQSLITSVQNLVRRKGSYHSFFAEEI
eukprot:g29696.t1